MPLVLRSEVINGGKAPKEFPTVYDLGAEQLRSRLWRISVSEDFVVTAAHWDDG